MRLSGKLDYCAVLFFYVQECCFFFLIRASLVQSRIKALARLPMLEQVAEDPSLRFKLKIPEEMSPPLLQLVDVTFKYKKRATRRASSPDGSGEDAATADAANTGDDLLIVRDCNLNVDMESRIAVSITGC